MSKRQITRRRGKPAHLVATQVRGSAVATAVLTEAIVLEERQLARAARREHGELPLGWTAKRAARRGLSRQSYERSLYGETYAHVAFALTRRAVR